MDQQCYEGEVNVISLVSTNYDLPRISYIRGVPSVSTVTTAERLVGRIPTTRSLFFSVQAIQPVDKPIDARNAFVGTTVHLHPAPTFFLVAFPDSTDFDAESTSRIVILEW
jgi:hypothetical protein